MLLTILHLSDLNKFEVAGVNNKLMVTTAEEAHKIVQEKITAFFASLGIVPNFIIENQ